MRHFIHVDQFEPKAFLDLAKRRSSTDYHSRICKDALIHTYRGGTSYHPR